MVGCFLQYQLVLTIFLLSFFFACDELYIAGNNQPWHEYRYLGEKKRKRKGKLIPKKCLISRGLGRGFGPNLGLKLFQSYCKVIGGKRGDIDIRAMVGCFLQYITIGITYCLFIMDTTQYKHHLDASCARAYARRAESSPR